MASGIVAKKIALFEIKPQSLEQQCRLKRKHAIRRKKYRGKERRVVTREGTSMIALSTSDEHLNRLKDYDETSSSSSSTSPHYSQYSASCSALFDMVSVESSDSGGVTVQDKTLMEIIPRNKKLLFRSGSKENFSKRVNIIDIDIEIKIEKKERELSQLHSLDIGSASCDEYEPLCLDSEKSPPPLPSTPAPVAVTTDRIHLTALVDDDDDCAERSVTYYCSKCSHEHSRLRKATASSSSLNNGKDNTNKGNKRSAGTDDSSPEPLYENIFCSVPPPPVSLGAPPLPPKRLFGDSFTTNYSCLPALKVKDKRAPATLLSSAPEKNENDLQLETTKLIQTIESLIKKPAQGLLDDSVADLLKFRATSTSKSASTANSKKIRDHVTEPLSSCNPLLPITIPSEDVTTRIAPPAICLGKDKNERNTALALGTDDKSEDDEEEPFYEDLYDYCNGSDRGNGNSELLINPLLELFRDQLHSLEQNVEDEVEYCDCSTILTLMNSDGARNDNENSQKSEPVPEEDSNKATVANKFANFSPEQIPVEIGGDAFSLKSYEIYDDCFGVVDVEQSGECGDGGSVNMKSSSRDISNDDIGCMPKSGETKNAAANNTVTRDTSTSSNLADYASHSKLKPAKASTPGCWRRITSSPPENEVLAESQITTNSSNIVRSTSTPSPSSSSSNLLSVFPSLSVSKTKLVEPKGAANGSRFCAEGHYQQQQLQSDESLPNEASSSSQQAIAENERNMRNKTKNGCTYAYGIHNNVYGCGGSNGNSKPRFGGRPVIAHHPAECAEDDHNQADKGKNNENDNNQQSQSGDGLCRKNYKKDDNEIFNKPLPLPPSNSNYESVYEEPIYGITNQLTATYSDNGKPGGGGGSPGKRRTSITSQSPPFISNKLGSASSSKPGSTYSHSPSISSGSTYDYSSGSINEYGDTGSTPKYGQSSGVATPSSIQTSVSTTASDGMSIYGINDKLPPTPPNKFSSIAKTAGRKIAKKFLGIRKTSKCGLDEPLSVFSTNGVNASADNITPPQSIHVSADIQRSRASNPSLSVTTGNSNVVITEKIVYSGSTGSNNSNNGAVTGGGGGGNGAQIRRPISRPSIPPPEPPKNEGATFPPLPPHDKSNDYSIYDKRNEDDYEDSDFYDSDSELIRNFVSQVQPIYSMEEEPLYQYYTYGISLKPDDDYQPVIPKNLGLTLDMLVPRVGQRTLWCELPGVVSSGILSILSDKQKQLQEAIFEILTSEVSYLKSLDVLITLFYKNEELVGVLTEEERSYLFGNIEDVRDCSQSFLSELLGKWEESWYIQEIGEIISRNTETRFAVYKEYCRNKPYQDKTMQRLRHSRDEFVSVVKAIEEDEKCQMLQVDSFLMLPMQRITRLPLLVNAVIQRTAAGKEKCKCEEALKCLTNLVLACNDAARESQDAEETMAILEKLEYTRGIKSLPDLGQFIMKGDFMKNPFDHGRGNQINWTFRKAKRTFYWLLLFSKQLLVARRKANGRFEIIDMIDPLESSIKALPNLDGVSKDYKHFFMLHFSRKETVYFLAARTNSEVERWKSKLDGMKPKEELRVEAIFPYDARRPDEMSFYVGDVIRVSQMQPDGWYYGTKLATGESGWFPGNYCCENAN